MFQPSCLQKLFREHRQVVQPCPGGWSHLPTRLRRQEPPCPWKAGSFHGKFPLCRAVLCRRLSICLPGRLHSILFLKNRVFVLQSHAWGKNTTLFLLSLFPPAFFYFKTDWNGNFFFFFKNNMPFLPGGKGISTFWQGLYGRTQTE